MKKNIFIISKLLLISLFMFCSNNSYSQYCSSNGKNTNYEYIGRVELATIDNTSGVGTTSTGYSNFTGTSTSLNTSSSYTITITPTWTGSTYSEGYAVWIDYNQNNDFTDAGELVWSQNATSTATVAGSFTVPGTASSGNTKMRVSMKWNATPTSCEIFTYGEVEDYTVTILTPSSPDINVTGNSNSISGSGTNSPTISDNTDFGTLQIGSEKITKTFVIENTGTANLTLGNISLLDANDFIIDSSPSSGTIIAPGGTGNILVSFNTTIKGTQINTLSINSDDPDSESNYLINLTVYADKIFYDSDNDGVYDDVDIDDDNDGIIDSEEETSCSNSPISYEVNYKFLEETFGTGNRTTINTTYSAISDYCYEDGTNGTNTGSCPQLSNDDLSDGEYVVYHKASNGDGIDNTPVNEVASWADAYWYTGGDHTGDALGRMAMFNADYDPGIFYTAHIRGSLPGIPITYSFWVLNLDTTLAPGIDTRLRPDIKVEFKDMNNNVLATITTGDIPPSINGDPAGSWHQFTANLVLPVNEFQVIFTNNETGGLGNDLALDDIEIKQTLCDFDNDGIADLFDLDDDNDGIPDIVEVGLGSLSNGTGKLDVAWVDANGDGLHDSAANNTLLDSDGDGIPNYHDLDSDNDGIFDVDEAGTGNPGDIYFQNGDGDITGDGVGDGIETEAFREKDVDGNGITEYYGDGILDVYDFHSSANNYTDAYGNENQGTVTGTVYYVKDTDLDGIPDYIDITSNGTTFDILSTLYANLDTDNNGIIDDTTDTDGDGLVDSFDTNDNQFGSPRDLDRKLHLFFDGRNDYGEDTNVLNSGSGTIMVFIRSNGDNTLNEDRIIAGQDDFFLRVNDSDNTVSVVVEGTTLTSTSTIVDGIWTHIAATTESGTTKLYINGNEEASNTSGGITDNSNFIIGRSSAGNKYYHGYIDELRIFNKALTANELRKTIYQELTNNANYTRGAIIPLDITDYNSITKTCTKLPWVNMKRYFRMDAYKDDILDDYTTSTIDTGTGAKIYNTKIIDIQSAPLPFITQQCGDLATALNIGSEGVNGSDAITYDWSIINISHENITCNTNQKHIGVIVDELDSGNPIEFSIQNDSELNVSWYLKLDGMIDLDDESQLVQGADSTLDVTSKGSVERDQQGTKDLYTYNYWSSPVGTKNITANNTSITLNTAGIFKDGTTPSTPLPITFITNNPNGTSSGSGIGIADYWIWKYADNISSTYSEWEHVRSTGTINAGEGFTMKGVADTGGIITQTQNYVFNGKPNNGDISLTISSNNDYLVGNPYPSALDADEFIKDNLGSNDGGRNTNGNIINGVLYFWDHFASSTHILAQYEGGYATYTLMGGAPAVSTDTRINATGETGTKIPKRYIPIGQGFFVSAILDSEIIPEPNDPEIDDPILGGTIVFKNIQRVFATEASGNSKFIKISGGKSKSSKEKTTEDTRQKIRLTYDSPTGYHRQLLAGVDTNASSGFDLGYDAPLGETNNEDMFWMFNNSYFVIQAIDNFEVNQKLPIGLKVSQDGIATIKIDDLENIANDVNIYIHDKKLDTYHDLRQTNYEILLTPNTYIDRFEITFSNAQSLEIDTVENNNLQSFYSNTKQSLILYNPLLKDINSVEIFNILGQLIYKTKKIKKEKHQELKTKKISSGTYIIKVNTKEGIFSKKVLIK